MRGMTTIQFIGIVIVCTLLVPAFAFAEQCGVDAGSVQGRARGELDRSATVSEMETVQEEGVREVMRQVDFFNLDAIIAVGYRVNS